MARRLKDRVICVDPNFVQPLHGITDDVHFQNLTRSMLESGWLGRPLVVVPMARGHYRAATGSHRWGAAMEASLDRIPILPLDVEEMEIIKKSKEGYDPDLERIYSAELAGDELIKRGHTGIGMLLLSDFLVIELEQTPESPLPWTKEALEFYRKSGFGDPEALEVMSVKGWKCKPARRTIRLA